MTFAEKMKALMVEHGMWEDDTQTVMDIVTANTENSMYGRWNDEIDDYPPQMIPAVWLGVKYAAYQWLDANKPNAWYKPVFKD
jgi:hypothetical protein